MNRERSCDVLVVGSGPAGLAAAATAAECESQVVLVDDNPTPGGQIWRGETGHPGAEVNAWTGKLHAAKVELLSSMRVVHQPEPGILLGEDTAGPCRLRYRRLILATGARERFLPFPGWTLPNVMGAGGLQTLVKSGLPIAGKRVVVAGTGPLLLAVAAYLRQHGAEVPVICEQQSWGTLARFGISLAGEGKKLRQALSLKSQLSGIRFAANSWPVEAHGAEKLQAITIFRSGRRETIACDYLACGFHLVPNIELAVLLGCALRDGLVAVDDWQQTSVSDVYCAGEPTGIGGVELAIVEGQIAGFAAAGERGKAQTLSGLRRKPRRFAKRLDSAFRLRPALRTLCRTDTIVCRCEDVTFQRLQRYGSWREAKLQARCGMGPCQGRVCGPASEFLFGWKMDSVRPPIFPAKFSTVAGLGADPVEVTGGHS